jgi:CBS domain-containing protein
MKDEDAGRKRSKRGRQAAPPLHAGIPQEEGALAPGPPGDFSAEPAEPGRPVSGSQAEPGARHDGPSAGDFMTEDPVCCLADTPLSQVARLMAENACGAVPVVKSTDDRVPIGMLTDRDIALRAVAQGRNPMDLRAKDIYTPVVATVEPETPLAECELRMREHNVHRLVVVDATGRICGLLSKADLEKPE